MTSTTNSDPETSSTTTCSTKSALFARSNKTITIIKPNSDPEIITAAYLNSIQPYDDGRTNANTILTVKSDDLCVYSKDRAAAFIGQKLLRSLSSNSNNRTSTPHPLLKDGLMTSEADVDTLFLRAGAGAGADDDASLKRSLSSPSLDLISGSKSPVNGFGRNSTATASQANNAKGKDVKNMAHRVSPSTSLSPGSSYNCNDHHQEKTSHLELEVHYEADCDCESHRCRTTSNEMKLSVSVVRACMNPNVVSMDDVYDALQSTMTTTRRRSRQESSSNSNNVDSSSRSMTDNKTRNNKKQVITALTTTTTTTSKRSQMRRRRMGIVDGGLTISTNILS